MVYKGEVLDGLSLGDYLWVIKEKYSMGCPLMVNLPVPLFHTVTSALAVLRFPGERSAAIRRMLHTAQHLDSCALFIEDASKTASIGMEQNNNNNILYSSLLEIKAVV